MSIDIKKQFTFLRLIIHKLDDLDLDTEHFRCCCYTDILLIYCYKILEEKKFSLEEKFLTCNYYLEFILNKKKFPDCRSESEHIFNHDDLFRFLRGSKRLVQIFRKVEIKSGHYPTLGKLYELKQMLHYLNEKENRKIEYNLFLKIIRRDYRWFYNIKDMRKLIWQTMNVIETDDTYLQKTFDTYLQKTFEYYKTIDR